MHFRGTNIEFSIIKALFLTSLYNCHFCLPVFFFFVCLLICLFVFVFVLFFALFFVLFCFVFLLFFFPSNLAITRHTFPHRAYQ